ncbi:MAG: ParB/RepB/Spo0J family partition protein [Oscillospiraceae bacterium]|nr:ParB/RepB/Spo0J family partition protein [Oscillospiraceae bacterium]MDD4414670.1 ParB/RepB/Spo0J family partition protein [Oscillospiraceae bacterium]
MNIGKKRNKYKSNGQILMIPTGDICLNPQQPRREISYERLLELAQSIDENGLLHPITITFIGNKPMLVAGERRLRAAIIAGMREIPCIEVEADESRAALLTLIENIQREDMNYFEEAEGIRRLIMVHGFTQEEAANKLGCAQSTVANRLRILRLSQEEREVILKEGLTERHARALLRLEQGSKRWGALLRMAQAHLNVAQSERLVDELLEDEQIAEKHKRPLPLVRDVRLFFNTVNNAIDTMRRSGIEAKAEKTETDEYIEYLVRIPKGKTMAQAAESVKKSECTA